MLSGDPGCADMTLLARRTVASQIAAQLRSEIEKGTWRLWLPGERALCQIVQSNRKTIRAAIHELKAEGLVEVRRGIGNQIVAGARRLSKRNKTRTVGLLIPEPVSSLRPGLTLWIDELKELLLAENCLLRVHEGRRHYRANPARALEHLVAHSPHDAWVLALSSKAMQGWFARRHIPCLVAGSVHAGLPLPFCDLDFRSMCRHAVGVLHRLGHRRIALLNHEARRAGEINSEEGFLEGVRGFTREPILADVAYHRDDRESVEQALHRWFRQKEHPTGLVICNSYAYLTSTGVLAQLGLRVPRDISLISRDDDPFLEAMVPTPARYVTSPRLFASKMARPILQLASGAAVTRSEFLLLPKFVSGGSVTALG